MKTFLIAVLVCLVLGKADALLADPINWDLLKRYGEEIRENPGSCKRRWQRSLILLKHGDTAKTTREDIDTLLNHPLWRTQGNRLKALYLYLQGHVDEARAQMKQNIRDSVNVVEQSRLLARIELSRKDTVAAIAAYRLAWDQQRGEDVFVDLAGAYGMRGRPPKEFLQQGLKLYPNSPGVAQTVFEAFFAAGDSSSLKNCLKISGRAADTLWPRSVDWKIRHSRALLASGHPKQAEPFLLQALDLLDEDPRLQGEDGRLRKDLFSLLEKARQAK